jgi:hypothetical protein
MHTRHTFPPYFPKIHSNTYSHLRLCLPNDLFPSVFPTIHFYAFLIFPMRATYPSHLIILDLVTIIILGKVYNLMKLLILQPSLASRYFLPLRSKYSPQHPVLKHPQIYSLPLVSEIKLHTNTKTGKIIVLCILIFKILDRRWEDRRF